MILVLLPAFNEEASLDNLIAKIAAALSVEDKDYKIIVCDDGSTDETSTKLENLGRVYPLHILRHQINRGLGETCRDLFEYAAEHSCAGDVIVRMDCDDTHDPTLIKRMIEKLDAGHDIVIASRFQPGGGQVGVSAYRGFISRSANLFMKVFFPIQGVWEYSCGYRAYKAEIVQRAITVFGNNFIQLKGLGFTCTLEKLVKFKMLGARFAEVPFILRYDQKVSSSKMVISITTLGYLVMTILYHWPFGGWRTGMAKRVAQLENKRAAAGEPADAIR